MLTFRFKGKEYCGPRRLILFAQWKEIQSSTASRRVTSKILIWSLDRLGHNLPPRDLHLSDQLEDDELALSYLYLRDEYGAGKLLTDAKIKA